MKEWKDNSYFIKQEEAIKKETIETQEILDRLVSKGEITKEFDKNRNDWVYKPKEQKKE